MHTVGQTIKTKTSSNQIFLTCHAIAVLPRAVANACARSTKRAYASFSVKELLRSQSCISFVSIQHLVSTCSPEDTRKRTCEKAAGLMLTVDLLHIVSVSRVMLFARRRIQAHNREILCIKSRSSSSRCSFRHTSVCILISKICLLKRYLAFV